MAGWLALETTILQRLDFSGPYFSRITTFCYGFGHVTTGLGTWRAHGYLLYLVALLPLSLFFRFDVLVTIHLYDSL
jgi:hypothetical protein